MTRRPLSFLATLKDRFPFAHNVALLTSMTVLGQAITVLALPVLTRLYSPAAFGLLGTFMMLTMILATPACMRLEQAQLLPSQHDEAVNLLALALSSALLVGLAITGFVLLAPDLALRAIGQPGFGPYLWTLPLGVWLLATYSAFQFWSIRMNRLSRVAATQLTRAIGGTSAQIGLGLIGIRSFGLLIGQLLYFGIGIVALANDVLKHDSALLRAINLRKMAHLLREYRHFGFFSSPESLLNACAAYLPIIMIAAYSGNSEAGHALLAFRITSIPIGLIGGNLSRVYLAEGAERHRTGALNAFTRRIMRNLLLAALPMFGILAIIAPLAFPYIFGPAWIRAGEMVTWMTPFMFLQFICSPVSPIFVIKMTLKLSFCLQAFGFLIVVGSIQAVAMMWPQYCFEAFAVSSAIYYGAFLALIFILSAEQGQPARLTSESA